MSIDKELLPALNARRDAHLYRSRHILQSPAGPEVLVNGERCLAFCSNDYLGLANHPSVIAAFKRAADQYGVGSGAAHLVYGHSHEHHALEEELAAFTGRQRALLFSTGYMANIGVITALCNRGDVVYEDRLNHASLLDGGLSSNARFKRYRTLDELVEGLASAEETRKLVATDGVFSMDGNLAPLDELAKICRANKAWLMVDDAHGFGIVGQNGGGCAEHFALTAEELPILMGTLGKGFGAFGAFVAGNESLIETLIQFARTYIYTTALPPAVAAAARASLKLVVEEGWRRDKLQCLIARFRRGVQQLGLELMESDTPIQPVLLHDDELTQRAGRELQERGILVGAIRPPTVPSGGGRLRITLCADHSEQHVDQLLAALEDVVI